MLEPTRNKLKFAHFQFLREALHSEAAAQADGLRVLDVGCGPGNLPDFAGPIEGSHWYGLDLWEHQLRQAHEKRTYESLFQVNLVDGLPFGNERFNVVVCNEVLMYLPNAHDMLAEFHRVLTAEGKLFVYNPISSFPNFVGKLKRLARFVHQENRTIVLDRQRDWKRATRACRITYYSLDSLVEQVASADFRVTAVKGFRIFRNRIRLMKRLEEFKHYNSATTFLAGRFPFLASDILVVGAKQASRIR
jgi:ubiquinone/menaquinone biosynthesis C-methylase UbiE